jgi:hypothetical protein
MPRFNACPWPVLRVAPLAALALLAAGCASTPTVRSDYDKTADFGQYRTFGFVDKDSLGPNEGVPGRSLAMQTLETAATQQMQARGYTLAAEPDLLVVFSGKLEDKTDVQSVPGPYYGPAWGYGGWYGAPYGGWSSSQVTTRHYKVGTIVMDIVDRGKKQVVFQAGIERTVTNKMLENRDTALTEAVGQLFAAYPFVAGQSAAVAPPKKQ